MLMIRFTHFFRFCIAADTACKCFFTFLFTGWFFCDLSLVPAMILCFCNYLTGRNPLPTIFTISVSAVTFFLAGRILLIADFRMLMACCTHFFCFCIAADTACKCFFTFLFTGWFCCDLSLIPAMILCSRNYMTGGNIHFAIFTIGISTIALILAGRLFFIADYRVQMVGFVHFFCFCIAADRAGKCFFALFYAVRFCCDLPLIPVLVTFMHIYRWQICCCQSVQRCR